MAQTYDVGYHPRPLVQKKTLYSSLSRNIIFWLVLLSHIPTASPALFEGQPAFGMCPIPATSTGPQTSAMAQAA